MGHTTSSLVYKTESDESFFFYIICKEKYLSQCFLAVASETKKIGKIWTSQLWRVLSNPCSKLTKKMTFSDKISFLLNLTHILKVSYFRWAPWMSGWDLPAGSPYIKELQSGWNSQSFRPICIPPTFVLLCCTSYLRVNLVITDKNHIEHSICWLKNKKKT